MKLYIILELYGGASPEIKLVTTDSFLADQKFNELQMECLDDDDFDCGEELDECYEIYLENTDQEEYYLLEYDLPFNQLKFDQLKDFGDGI